MNTPICDFVNEYARSNALRLHMPGHKGAGMLGVEQLDITEVHGADSLYEADGIIHQSEANASAIFGCPTYYSTEGSSQCIRAMLYLALLQGRRQGRRPLVFAARNVHKTFLSAAALLDLDVEWIYADADASYLSCRISAGVLDQKLSAAQEKPFAVYITSPDYLGNMANVASLAKICHKHDVLLLVDNAHGAYLKFLPESLHPIDLGADMCCDSAHKTLPVLTGGAYLHLSNKLQLGEQVKNALALFGSTSPSYLILQSLDAANKTLEEGYRERLHDFILETAALREHLRHYAAYSFIGEEPLKLTISAKERGGSGKQYASALRAMNIECEFADPDYAVLMLTPETGTDGLAHLKDALQEIPWRNAWFDLPPSCRPAARVLSIREAMLSDRETVNVDKSIIGRVLADASVGCPPAVPILVCGERIDACALRCFEYYGIKKLSVVKEA